MSNIGKDCDGNCISKKWVKQDEVPQFEHKTTKALREDTSGKGRFDLVSPIGLRRLALVCERGAHKYSDRNWERGLPISNHVDSALRHITSYLLSDRSEDHLASALWRIMACIHTEEMVKKGKLPQELMDLPDYE